MSTARRRIITILLIAAAATSFMFATGAVVVSGPADTVADDRLTVQPADGPNGDYAYLNDDNEITIDISPGNPNLPNDFDGVNADTLAATGSVFTITYTADEYARIWIDNPEENTTFVTDGGSIEGEANNVTLRPNESVAVGLRIDARSEAGTTVGGDDFSINALVVDSEDDSTDTGPTGSGPDESTSGDDTPAAADTDVESTGSESNASTSDDDTPAGADADVESTGSESDALTSDDDTPAGADADMSTDGDTTDTPSLEPAGIDLDVIGGLALLLVLVVVTVVLGRRISWP